MDGISKMNLPQGYSIEKPDNRILSATLSIMEKHPDTETILITNDVSMSINAIACMIKVQPYKNAQIVEDTEYTGRYIAPSTKELIDRFCQDGTVDNSCGLEENEYVTFQCGTQVALDVNRKGTIYKLRDQMAAYGAKAKNVGQRFALDALLAPPEEIPLVILKGPAGCAKTFLSLASGLEQAMGSLDNPNSPIRKVMITRNNVLSDADLGFLPGTLEEKMDPLVAPFFDNLESLIREHHPGEKQDMIRTQAEDLLETGIMEVCSIAYMRGRSITNAFLIIDEAQNATRNQILEIVTRAGKDCKIVLCGDPEQIDNPRLDRRNNGLVFASERMKGSPLCAQITFDSKECVRSPLSTEAAKRLSEA